MSQIQVLDQSTIDNIAAGEVIERPASVVKELMENAIDAQSSAVTVEIKDGGKTLIRVTDNGCGIEKEDVKTAFLRHATSKIRSVTDLITVSSLGFRGEALSSIAAISQVELISKTSGAQSGVSYEIHGGKEQSFSDAGVPDGTTFIVRNLFYNTPARRKFLKSGAAEAGAVEQIFIRLALSHPEVSFKLISEKKERIYTPGNGRRKDMIYQVFGRETALALVPVDLHSGGIHVSGYIAKPSVSRGNRNYECYFINGRFIKSALISQAIEEAYKTFTMAHRYPFVCLEIEMDHQLLDINVHPTKMEIRFSNGQELHDLLATGIRSALRNRDLTVDASAHTKKKRDTVLPAEHQPPKETLPKTMDEGKNVRELPLKGIQLKQKDPEPELPRAREPHKDPRPVEKTGGSQETMFPQGKPEQITLNETSILDKKAVADRKVIGQLFETYWLIEYEDQLFILDQHAAHEKVNYEKIKKQFQEETIYGQRIEPPFVITLSMAEERTLEEFRDQFESLGFQVEPFGGKEYCIRQVPANIFGLGEQELFVELLDTLSGGIRVESLDMITGKIASMACRASAKGNQHMSVSEADRLLSELMELDDPYNCPHGRPTMIKMSKKEIEKKFKRIV